MFSIPKKRKPIKYRNSQVSIQQKPFPQNDHIQKIKYNLSTDQIIHIRKWNSASKTSQAFKILPLPQHQSINRHTQIRTNNKSTHFQRKTVHRISKNEQTNTNYFYIKNQGNNSDRVSEILSSRKNWVKCLSQNHSPQIDFYWGAFSKVTSKSKNLPFSNRISGSYQLTDKARLYHNIVNYCSKNKISNEKFLPVTFCFTSRQLKSQNQQSIREFLDYFEYIQSHTSLTNSWIMKPTNLNRGRDIFLFNSLDKLLNLLHVGNSFHINSELQPPTNKLISYKSGHQFQLSKNDKNSYKLIQDIQSKINFNRYSFNHSNHVSSTKKTLPMPLNSSEQQIRTAKNSLHKSRKTVEYDNKINPQCFRARQKSLKQKTQVTVNFEQIEYENKKKQSHRKLEFQKIQSFDTKQESGLIDFEKNQIEEKLCKVITNFVQSKSSYGQKSVKRQIVIQKYIENPFLINGNKFDIRIWVLVDQEFNFYIFKSGYLRFSSEKYRLDEKSIENNFIHLTNHAVQKFSDKYQKESNIVKMGFLKEYLQKKQNYPKSITKTVDQKYQEIWREMERIITISLQATLGIFYRQQHNKQKYDSNQQFQLYGYDFLLDRELNVRLIEANCNPSITEDNVYLEQAVPRMLNDMFKLTVDRVFLPRQKTGEMFYMEGFGLENMWKRLGKIGQVDIKAIKNCCQ